jgi:hypothetical protein
MGEVSALGPLDVVVSRVVLALQQGTRHVRATDVLYGVEKALAVRGWPS